MAITDNYVPIKESGNGVTTQFSGNWNVINANYIRVYWEDKTTGVQTLKIKDTHYTLSFTDAGFTVTFLGGFVPASTVWVVIGREVAKDQSVPYKTSQGFQGAVQENSYDKLTGITQDLQDQVDRSPKLPLGVTDVNLFLPLPEAGKTLIWNAAEDSLENGPDADEVENAQGYALQTAADVVTTGNNVVAAQAAAATAQAAAAGMKWRPSVRVATTANITLSAPQTIDGISAIAGDRVLVKNQSAPAQNGVYVVAAGSWGRADDANTWSELISQVVAVEEGTVNADYTFICTINQGGTLDTTAVTWDKFKIILPDGAVSTAAKIVDGIITYAKLATAAVATIAELFSGAASKLVSAAVFKTFVNSYFYVEDQKSSGTAGGTFTSGAWQTHALNTTVGSNGITGASLATNQITLPAGTYEASFMAVGHQVEKHQTRLQDVTNTATLLTGIIANSDSSTRVMCSSHGRGRFTLTGTTLVELQHQCSSTKATDGFGQAGSFGVEKYAGVYIQRVG